MLAQRNRTTRIKELTDRIATLEVEVDYYRDLARRAYAQGRRDTADAYIRWLTRHSYVAWIVAVIGFCMVAGIIAFRYFGMTGP